MKHRIVFMLMLLLIVPALGLYAQNGDPISDDGGGGGDGGDDGSGEYSGGDEVGDCDDPDSRPPVIFTSRPLSNLTVQCFSEVPPPPKRVWAIDACDGERPVVTNETQAGMCPTRIHRSWYSEDKAGNPKTRSEIIAVNDTTPPSIVIASEITLEAENCGTAILPDFTKRVTDNCCLKSTSQSPPPGVTNKVGAEFPVKIEAADQCNTTSKTFTVKVVCKKCKSCSPGNGDPEDKSIRLDLNLGQLADGRSAGYLSLYAQQPDKRIFSPEALCYDWENMGATTIRDTNGYLRQIRSADVLLDIVDDNGYFCSYDINIYSPGNWGSPDATGLYVPSGKPFVSWRVFAPETLAVNGGVIGDPKHVTLWKQQGGKTVQYDYLYGVNQQGWTLTSGSVYDMEETKWRAGLKVETRSSAWSGDGTLRTETDIIASPSGVESYREVNEYRQYPWGEARVKTIQGAGISALTNERAYYEDPLQPDRYARLAWERQPDGNFIWRDYDSQGRVIMEAHAWKDVDVPVLESNALMATAAITLYDFTPVDTSDNGLAWPWNPRVITEQVAGTVVSKTYFAYFSELNGEITEIKKDCVSPTASYGDASNRTTRTVYYSNAEALWSGQIKSVEYPDGRLDRYVLERGQWVTNADSSCFSPLDSGDYLRTTLIHGTMSHPEGTSKTTREVSVRPVLGKDVLRETYVSAAGVYYCADWTRLEYDERGHLVAEHFASGLSRSSVWSDCCGKESDTDVDGVQIMYGHDSLGRIDSRTKLGVPKISATPGYAYQPPLLTVLQLDAVGNVLKETQQYGDEKISAQNTYDLAGQLVETKDASRLTTRHDYSPGGRQSTVIRPGGATEITENYLDGRTKSVTGTGVVPRFYDYGVNPDGSQWTMVHVVASNSPQWEKTTTDMLGRTLRIEKPGFNGALLTTTYDYNVQGQLIAVRQWEGNPPATQIGVATLYEYDELGEQIRVAQDLNGNGVIDLEGPDRVSETLMRFTVVSGERWRETVSKVYPGEGNSSPVIQSVQRRQMKGEGSGSSFANTESVDVRGNTNRTSYMVDPVQKIVTITQNPPDSTVDAITILRNGLSHSTRPAIWRDPTYYAYDEFGRCNLVTDPRTGDQVTVYNERNQVSETRDGAGISTQYEYDPETGLRISVKQSGKEVFTAYDVQGRATNVWGSTYPVAYEYDAYGRMSVMKTWRDASGEPDVTRWNYDEATGLLTNKVYADGSGPSYEYEAAGRLTKRTWARGVSAQYAYDAIGQLTNINYSDDTPDVAFTYDRLGRQVTVTDVLGIRTNIYDPSMLNLASEQLPNGQTIARTCDMFGRETGFSLGDDYQVAYAYDDVGRFSAITSAVNTVTSTVTYAYLAQSDLVSGWNIRNPSNPRDNFLSVQRSFEPKRDLVSGIALTDNGECRAQYDYVNDRLGRRIARNDSVLGGSMVSNAFGYNARSELDAAVMGTNQFGYQYDAIGNRQAAIANALTNLYQANGLNQYSSILPSAGTPAYDPDGNMISNGIFTMTWDAENRLVEVRPVVTNAGSRLIQFMYDYLGRRIGRREFNWGTFSGNDNWYWASGSYYQYDGWNLLGEFEPPERPRTFVPYLPLTNTVLLGVGGTAHAFYLWGLDLSGTLQGAGGVGGLLAQIRPNAASPWFSFSDANGNVTELVDTNGSVVAHYEYDPYGNLLAQSGAQAAANPFRFSTKYWDDALDLYYYGYRFYSPILGRWLGRDPIEEDGGSNLYGYVGNAAIGKSDAYGLYNFVASGTGAYVISLPGKESSYLQKRGEYLLNIEVAGVHGSRASFAGYALSLGRSSWWDSVREGNQIAKAIIKNDDAVDRGLGHSQGVRVSLEGVYRAARQCNDKGVCCKDKKTIKLVLMAPKVRSGYIDSIHKEVKRLQPNWNLQIMIVYSPTDKIVPKGGAMPWPGEYVKTSYAEANYQLLSIIAPWPAHSSTFLSGEQPVGRGEEIEKAIKGFLR